MSAELALFAAERLLEQKAVALKEEAKAIDAVLDKRPGGSAPIPVKSYPMDYPLSPALLARWGAYVKAMRVCAGMEPPSQQAADGLAGLIRAMCAEWNERAQDDPGKYYRRQLHRREAEKVVQEWRDRTGGQNRYGELEDAIVGLLDVRP